MDKEVLNVRQTGNNYRAWKPDYDNFYSKKNFTEQMQCLLQFAVLAPSSHNSQPWAFKITQNGIDVLPASERALAASDINHRQLYISLGCAIANLMIAADYYDLTFEINYLTDRVSIKLEPKLSTPTKDENHLIFSIPRRTNNREKYKDSLPSLEFLNKFLNYDPNIQIHLIEDSKRREEIADLTVQANIEAMKTKAFRKELSKYIKNNFTKSFFGMPGFTIGMPSIVSLLAPTIVKFLNVARANKKQDTELLKKFTPMFVIISTRDDNQVSWLKAGQIYENIALEAVNQGLNTAVMAGIIEIGDYHKKLQVMLNTNFRPQVFFRLGKALSFIRHSPRFKSKDVIL